MSLAHLENAPLVEAIIELTFSGEPAVLTRIDEYYEGIRQAYPQVWVPYAQLGQAPALQPWEFKNNDNTRCIAISLNSYTYRVKDYIDYADFREHALPLVEDFCEMFGIREVNRLAARFVNNIALLRLPGEPIRLQNYLKLGLTVPDVTDGKELEDIHLQFVSRSDSLQTVINLHHQAGEPTVPESLILVLDCALVDNVLVDNVQSDIDTVHSRIETVFESIVADTYMRYLKGETG